MQDGSHRMASMEPTAPLGGKRTALSEQQLRALSIEPIRDMRMGEDGRVVVDYHGNSFCWWVSALYGHRHFRVGTAFESELRRYMPEPPSIPRFRLRFRDEVYDFYTWLPKLLTFSTTDDAFTCCLSTLLDLLRSNFANADDAVQADAPCKHELNPALYSCFRVGAPSLAIAWGGGLVDDEPPSEAADYLRSQRDGIVGLSKDAFPSSSFDLGFMKTRINVENLSICDGVIKRTPPLAPQIWDQLLLIFRALWYLRLHGLHLASSLKEPANFILFANYYSFRAGEHRITDIPRSCEPTTSPYSDEGEEEKDDDYNNTENKNENNNNNYNNCHVVECLENNQKFDLLPDFISKSRRVEIQLAKNQQTGEVVALKRRADENYSRQDQECEALQALRGCEGIVRLYGETTDDELVLQYLGPSVPLNDPSVTSEMFRGYFSQLLKALLQCERKGIVHHDVKAANIIFTAARRTVLIDFDHSLCIGKTGWTPGYTPPELHSGEAVVRASSAIDVWSAGIVLLEGLLCIWLKRDDVALAMVKRLHKAPPGKTLSHLCDWIDALEERKDHKFEYISFLPTPGCPNRYWRPSPHCCEEAFQLARWMLAIKPKDRPRLEEALQHPFFSPQEFK
ncbi:Protein kinase domain-containing protein [Balamuthia mandrillaris]